MNYETLTYPNQTGHGGMNQRLNGRLLSDIEFEQLFNADISTPGLRQKRKAPGTGVCLLLAPTLAAVSSPTATTLTISWTLSSQPGDATVIERSTDAVTYAEIAVVVYPTATYVDTGLSTGVTYYYRARARVDCDSTVSNVVSGLTVGAVITLNDTLIDGYKCVPYTGQVTASGGTGPYTYAVISGAIPAGLSMSTAGAFTGEPTSATGETATFTVRATDSLSQTGSRAYSVTIVNPCLILGVPTPCGAARDCPDCCTAMSGLGIGGSLLNQSGQTNISLSTCLGITVSGSGGSFVWCGKTFTYSLFLDHPADATCSAFKLYDILRTA
jgi:hypothetical protein